MQPHAVPVDHSSSIVFGTIMVGIGVGIGTFGAWRYVVERAALHAGSQRSLSSGAAVAIVVVLALFGAVTAFEVFRGPG